MERNGNKMKKATIISIILGIFIEIPIWLFLLHTILSKLDVDRLVWFLYIIYIPTLVITSICAKILGETGTQ
jgi:hypothetical protein